MASPISALSNVDPTSTNTSSAANSANSAPSEEVFLQLLVAQIQNQNPLDPMDSTQFVSQLAQFSELEQVIGIRQDIESQMSSSSTQTSTTPSATTNTNTQSPSSSAADNIPASSALLNSLSGSNN